MLGIRQLLGSAIFLLLVEAGPFYELGEGDSTAVFGGGNTPDWKCRGNLSATERKLDLSTRCKCVDYDVTDSLEKLADKAAVGQAVWISKQIFAQTFKFKPRKTGIFVEFGARDGRYQSNTFLFEAAFRWEGIMIEAGRNAIAPLRRFRRCTVHGHSGACVWSALDDKGGDYIIPAEGGSFPTKTQTLDGILHHFQVQHVHLLTADCEGCEDKAFKGLTLSTTLDGSNTTATVGTTVGTTVGVILLEFNFRSPVVPSSSCGIIERLALRHNYVVLPLWYSYDLVFVSPHTAQLMDRPPDYSAQRPGPGKRFEKEKLVKLRLCPSAEQLESRIWQPGQAWPPAFIAAPH